jgi:hypothetical protein
MAPHLRAGPEALLRGDRFDLDALDDATAQAKGVVAELEAARAQLEKVRGGPLEPGVDETRRWASGRLDEALGRARPLVATLEAMPAALGVGESRRRRGQADPRRRPALAGPGRTPPLPPGGAGHPVARFLSGNDLVATGRVLGAAGAGRNVQVYAADPQVLLDPPVLRVEVTAPPGMAPAPTDGWTVEDGVSVLSRRLITTTTATLDLHG